MREAFCCATQQLACGQFDCRLQRGWETDWTPAKRLGALGSIFRAQKKTRPVSQPLQLSSKWSLCSGCETDLFSRSLGPFGLKSQSLLAVLLCGGLKSIPMIHWKGPQPLHPVPPPYFFSSDRRSFGGTFHSLKKASAVGLCPLANPSITKMFGCGCQNPMGSHFGVGAPRILVYPVRPNPGNLSGLKQNPGFWGINSIKPGFVTKTLVFFFRTHAKPIFNPCQTRI